MGLVVGRKARTCRSDFSPTIPARSIRAGCFPCKAPSSPREAPGLALRCHSPCVRGFLVRRAGFPLGAQGFLPCPRSRKPRGPKSGALRPQLTAVRARLFSGGAKQMTVGARGRALREGLSALAAKRRAGREDKKTPHAIRAACGERGRLGGGRPRVNRGWLAAGRASLRAQAAGLSSLPGRREKRTDMASLRVSRAAPWPNTLARA